MRRAPAATTEVLEVTGGAPLHGEVAVRGAKNSVPKNMFGYVSALNEMGAQVQLYRECLGGMPCRFGQRNHLHSAVVAGPRPLQAADVAIPDLRGGFSYVIAALVAEGTSTRRNTGIIRRGYEDFATELQSVGAKVRA